VKKIKGYLIGLGIVLLIFGLLYCIPVAWEWYKEDSVMKKIVTVLEEKPTRGWEAMDECEGFWIYHHDRHVGGLWCNKSWPCGPSLHVGDHLYASPVTKWRLRSICKKLKKSIQCKEKNRYFEALRKLKDARK